MEKITAPAKRKKHEGFTKTDYNFAASRLDHVIEVIASSVKSEYFLQKLLLEHLHVPHVGRLIHGVHSKTDNYDDPPNQYPNFTLCIHSLWLIHRAMEKAKLFPVYTELMEKEGYGINVLNSSTTLSESYNDPQPPKPLVTLTGPKWEARVSKWPRATRPLDSIVGYHSSIEAWRTRNMYNFELVPGEHSNRSFYLNDQWYMIKAEPKEEIPNLKVYEFLGSYIAGGERLEVVKKIMERIVKPLSEHERRLLVAFYHGGASIPGAHTDLMEEIQTLNSRLAVAQDALEQLGKREFLTVDNIIINYSAQLMTLATSRKVHRQVNKTALALIKIE